MNKKMILPLLIILVVVAIGGVIWYKKTHTYTMAPTSVSATNIASYNSKVQFSQGQVINFPDFNLQYTGKSSTPGPNGAQWSIDDYNFIINKGNNQQQIAWSSGTGLVLPIPFSFNGKNYTIEMAYSQKLGDLSNNELVIEEAPK